MQVHQQREQRAPFVTVKTKFQITIPNKLRRRFSLKIGDVLEADIKNNKIVLSPKKLVDRDLEAVLAESAKDFKEGRVHGPFQNIREFKAAMRKLEKSKK